MKQFTTQNVICEVRFPATKAGNVVGFNIVQAHGVFYLNQFSDMAAGRGCCVRRWLTSNGALRHLAYFLIPVSAIERANLA